MSVGYKVIVGYGIETHVLPKIKARVTIGSNAPSAFSYMKATYGDQILERENKNEGWTSENVLINENSIWQCDGTRGAESDSFGIDFLIADEDVAVALVLMFG